MTPKTKNRLDELTISEISGVDSAANMLDGWLVLKSRGLVTDSDDPATIILKALADPAHPLTAEDILSDAELAWAQSAVQKSRPFVSNFGAIRPPGRPR